MGWESPTSYNDPSSAWTDDEFAYDDYTDTFAYDENVGAGAWSAWLELNIAAIQCDKVRFNAGAETDTIELQAYYNSAWQAVYTGTFLSNEWVEKALGGTYSVTASRMRFKNNDVVSRDASINEFDFWQVEAGAAQPKGGILKGRNKLTGTLGKSNGIPGIGVEL